MGPVIFTVLVVFCIFFAPEIITISKKEFRKSNAKLVLLTVLTFMVMVASFGIVLLPIDAMGKVVLCLLSMGIVTLMSIGVLGLAFVATIPEDMEEEAENEQSP